MVFVCDKCDKTFQWKKSLKRHKEIDHKKSKTFYRECLHCERIFENESQLFDHVRKSHGFYDGVRNVFIPPTSGKHSMKKTQKKSDGGSKRSDLLTKEFKKIGESFKATTNPNFKFKHPFCMMIAGPSRSGKTQWTMNLLRAKDDRIEPSPDKIVYCYMHWQQHYEGLRQFAPDTQFHEGLPHAHFLKELENCVVVLDDLMDVAMKEPAIMSIFTEGSHHRNVSVIFLSQNIFHQGKHSRTMSLNVQYMVLFKNARDQSQIQTLARQMFPTDWRSFLNHYKVETSKEYGHVILDLHPSTPDDQRIIVPLKMQTPTPSIVEQYYRMSNPYAQPLREAEQKMTAILFDPNISLEEKVKEHADALQTFTMMREKYQQIERGKHYSSPVGIITNPTPTPSGIRNLPASSPTPPGIHLDDEQVPSEESDIEPDTTMESLHYGEILPDGSDPRMLSLEDTLSDRKRKLDYIQKHIKDDEDRESGAGKKTYNLRK